MDGFDSAASTHVKQDKTIQPKPFKHGSLHLYAPLAGRRAGAPWGDPKLEGTCWCCTGFVVITCCGNNRVGTLVLYVVWKCLASPSVKGSISVAVQTKMILKWKRKEFTIDQLQSLHTWSEVLEFSISEETVFILFSVSVMLGVGFSIGSVWIIAGRLQMCPSGHSRQDYFRD